eukprot:g5524.t1
MEPGTCVEPVFVVIDKALCEAQGIELFAALSGMAITIFVCFFHTLQAIRRWLTTSKNKFPQDKVELAILYQQDALCNYNRRVPGYVTHV